MSQHDHRNLCNRILLRAVLSDSSFKGAVPFFRRSSPEMLRVITLSVILISVKSTSRRQTVPIHAVNSHPASRVIEEDLHVAATAE